MGLGSTAKKVQRLSNLAERLYEQVNEVLERLSDLTDRVERASEDVQAVRREQREQRAILEALAEEQGVDLDAVVAAVEHPDEDGTADDVAAGDVGGPDADSTGAASDAN